MLADIPLQSFCEIIDYRRTEVIHYQGRQLSKLVLPLFLLLHGKNLFLFPFRVDPFSEGLGVYKIYQEVTKDISL